MESLEPRTMLTTPQEAPTGVNDSDLETVQSQPFTTVEIAASSVILEDWSNFRINTAVNEPLFQPYPRGTNTQTMTLIPDGMRLTINSGNNIDWMFFPWPYVHPSGFAQGRIEEGQTWRNDINRLTFWVRTSHTYHVDGENDLSVGNYVKSITDTGQNNQGAHYYWLLGSTTFHADRWTKIVLTPKVQASNFSAGSTEFPINPDFFSELTRFYFGDNHPRELPNGMTWDFSPLVFDTVANEPDEHVATITGTYSGSRYEVTFSGRKNVNQTLEVRYSTSSMKVNGFASGTNGGTVTTTGDDYTRIRWNSPNMAEADNMYIAIRPQGMTEFTEIHVPKRSSASPLRAAGGPGTQMFSNEELLTDAFAHDIAHDTIVLLTIAGLSESVATKLSTTDLLVMDLSGIGSDYLALAKDNTIFLDDNAAGYGWSSLGTGSMDLVTVLLHEYAHILGHDHSDDPDDLLYELLSPGERWDDFAAAVDELMAAELD